MRNSRLSWYKPSRLIELFVASTKARVAVQLVSVNKTTASYYFHSFMTVDLWACLWASVIMMKKLKLTRFISEENVKVSAVEERRVKYLCSGFWSLIAGFTRWWYRMLRSIRYCRSFVKRWSLYSIAHTDTFLRIPMLWMWVNSSIIELTTVSYLQISTITSMVLRIFGTKRSVIDVNLMALRERILTYFWRSVNGV